MISNIKRLKDVKVGDTVAHDKVQGLEALPGYKEPKPMVFCGIYPTNPGDYDELRSALMTLSLNDSSFTYEPESSEALGFGFRCGFLGLLHMEIVQERLEREENMDIVQTAPTVTYEVELTTGETKYLHSPAEVPEPNHVAEFREPFVELHILVPSDSIGVMMKMCTERRGVYVKTEYLSATRVLLHYEMPLSEIIFDFFDRMKSATRGFGTMDYEFLGYRKGELVKLRIMVQGNEVDALSTIVHRDKAEVFGRKVIQKLRKEIPRHMFQVALQAAIGGKIVARENIRALVQERDGKVLRRRHHPKAQAVGQAEGRQEAHEGGRQRGDSAERHSWPFWALTRTE